MVLLPSIINLFATCVAALHLLTRVQLRDSVELHLLGRTLDGRDLHMLQVGKPGAGKANIWVIARQHPGESMAEWFAGECPVSSDSYFVPDCLGPSQLIPQHLCCTCEAYSTP